MKKIIFVIMLHIIITTPVFTNEPCQITDNRPYAYSIFYEDDLSCEMNFISHDGKEIKTMRISYNNKVITLYLKYPQVYHDKIDERFKSLQRYFNQTNNNQDIGNSDHLKICLLKYLFHHKEEMRKQFDFHYFEK